MKIIAQTTKDTVHVKSTRENNLIFNASAVEIKILDRLGKAIWKQQRTDSLDPISWNGIDIFGDKATSGSYTCKITYPDKFVVYVPFVFIQK